MICLGNTFHFLSLHTALNREHSRSGRFSRGHGHAQRSRPRRRVASSPGRRGPDRLAAVLRPPVPPPSAVTRPLGPAGASPARRPAQATLVTPAPLSLASARCGPQARKVRDATAGSCTSGPPGAGPGARSLPRPDTRGPRGAAPRSPAPGLRLPGAQDSPRGVPAPRCAPLTRPLGQKRGSWGPRRWLHPGLPIRDAPQGEATRARGAAAPRGHARVPRLPGDLGRRRGPGCAVSAASRRVAPQRHVLVLSDVRPKLGHRRAWPW